MENKLPKGYFFRNGIPTIENIRAWVEYFNHGGSKDDKKINLSAFKCVQEKMGWKSDKNGLVCFVWGLDENALKSKSTGDYAKLMVESRNLSWEIYKMMEEKVSQWQIKLYEHKLQSQIKESDNDFIIDYNNRLYKTGDIRYLYMKLDECGFCLLHFNYGKYIGRSIAEILEKDLNYMLYVVGNKSEISDWVKSDIWEFISKILESKKEKQSLSKKSA